MIYSQTNVSTCVQGSPHLGHLSWLPPLPELLELVLFPLPSPTDFLKGKQSEKKKKNNFQEENDLHWQGYYFLLRSVLSENEECVTCNTTYLSSYLSTISIFHPIFWSIIHSGLGEWPHGDAAPQTNLKSPRAAQWQ